LQALMNRMIVKIMNNETHASDKWINGYCAFHRLLLMFAKEYPQMKLDADNKIVNFIRFENLRTKQVIPDLGEFLILLLISEKSWEDLASAYLSESFDRHVLWILKKYPQLNSSSEWDARIEASRNALTFKGSLVALRLNAFHVQFLNLLGRPKGMNLEEIAMTYDKYFGFPTKEKIRHLREALDNILRKMKSWREYYIQIGLPCPTDESLNESLRKAVSNSRRKGYHRSEKCTYD